MEFTKFNLFQEIFLFHFGPVSMDCNVGKDVVPKYIFYTIELKPVKKISMKKYMLKLIHLPLE